MGRLDRFFVWRFLLRITFCVFFISRNFSIWDPRGIKYGLLFRGNSSRNSYIEGYVPLRNKSILKPLVRVINMVEFKIVIGDPASKRTYQKAISGADTEKLAGKKIGDKFRGELLSLAGYEFQITGGSDSAGFPMRKEVEGPGRKKILIGESVGYRSAEKRKSGKKSKIKKPGRRKRKTVRGNTISTDTAQVNCVVVKAGQDKLDKLFGIEKKEEAKPVSEGAIEAPKPEKK